MLRASNRTKPLAVPREDPEASGWNPSPDEIAEGFAFINAAQFGSEPAARLQWVIQNIKDKQSKIYRWPLSLVKDAIAKNDQALGEAEVVETYPILCWDFKPVIQEFASPLVFASSTLKGSLLIGMPNRGKTVFASSSGLAMGRHHVWRLGLDRKPCCCRGKQFDVFKMKPGEIQESILIDDPPMWKIDIEDIFITSWIN